MDEPDGKFLSFAINGFVIALLLGGTAAAVMTTYPELLPGPARPSSASSPNEAGDAAFEERLLGIDPGPVPSDVDKRTPLCRLDVEGTCVPLRSEVPPVAETSSASCAMDPGAWRPECGTSHGTGDGATKAHNNASREDCSSRGEDDDDRCSERRSRDREDRRDDDDDRDGDRHERRKESKGDRDDDD